MIESDSMAIGTTPLIAKIGHRIRMDGRQGYLEVLTDGWTHEATVRV